MFLPEKSIEMVLADSEEIIKKAKFALDRGRVIFEELGIDGEECLSRISNHLNEQQKKMLKQMIDSDEEDIQNEVNLEKIRLKLESKQLSLKPRKNRKII